MSVTWLVGLGNPGPAYAATRHNIGFLVLEELARRHAASWRRSWRFPVRMSRISLQDGRDAGLVQPLTFMNRSGDAVSALFRKRGISPESSALVFDDADLPLGRIRIRPHGGAGGHRGVQSVLERLGTDRVARIRVGVGRDRTGRELAEYVLGRFRPDEQEAVRAAVDRAADAGWCVLNDGVETAMNRFNPDVREQQEDM